MAFHRLFQGHGRGLAIGAGDGRGFGQFRRHGISADHFLNGGFTLLDHGQGVTTSYLHQSRRLVRAGETVRRGQVMGHIGATGRATGPHLHWAMNWFQVRLDPSRSTRTPAPKRL